MPVASGLTGRRRHAAVRAGFDLAQAMLKDIRSIDLFSERIYTIYENFHKVAGLWVKRHQGGCS